MARHLSLASAALILALSAGCAAPKKDYTKFLSAQPRGILVVPVVNKSVNIDAPDYFLSTIPIPVAERGYYVFPVNMVKRVLEDDGLSDAALVHGADPQKLAALFGADAVLYVTVERWDAKYIVIDTKVKVEFSYVLKDGKTGDVIWSAQNSAEYSSGQNNQGGLIGALVGAALTKAMPSYMPLVRRANAEALVYPGPGFPAGPYRPEYQKDL
jgi:hypothetical protein